MAIIGISLFVDFAKAFDSSQQSQQRGPLEVTSLLWSTREDHEPHDEIL